MQTEKLPPHDIDAEEAVLGSLLIDGTAIYKIATFLQHTDFYSERNLWIYQTCRALYERPENPEAINQITVAQDLNRQGKLEACGGVAYLSHLISICPTPLDIEHYAQIVYRLSVMRRLIDAADHIAAIGYSAHPNVDESLDRAEDLLYGLRHGQSPRDFIHIRQLLDKYFETTPTAEGEAYPEERIPYVLSGFTALDELLGGFQRSDLIIVAGRPSMGKTSLALNIARNAALNQKACVALFSLEMSQEALVFRLLSSESGINSRRFFRFGFYPEEDERRIMDAAGVLSELPIYIDDSPQLRVAEVRSKARRLYYERSIGMIIVDHLGLMLGDVRTENRVQEISFISRSLKALARELNVPVVAVSQLSRAVERRESHRPQLSDLRDSGSIEQDGDVVMFIYRDEYYHPKEEWLMQHPGENYPEGMADIMVAKHRNGPIGETQLRFRHALTKFENLASAEPSLL